MGGDQLTPPFLSLNNAPTAPNNYDIALFSGSDDYMWTRTYSQWLGVDYISMPRKDYDSLYSTFSYVFNPWPVEVKLNGTDGFQFHPSVEKTDYLSAWVNDLGRNGFFLYSDSDTTTYPHIEIMNFYIDPALMYKNNTDN